MFRNRYRIRRNELLRGPGPGTPLEQFLAFRAVAVEAGGKEGHGVRNIGRLGEETVRRVYDRHGEEGLFSLLYLAMGHDDREFDHFAEFLVPWWEAMAGPEVPLIPDNERLPECADLGRFTANLLQPSLSRKMYQPGRKHGYLVYGLGGPRILVSHPFRGSTAALYDMYTNASDVYTSLALAGYTGSFLFLDLLPGLNAEVHGLPGWLLWFSKIAVHSDLVLFVTEGDVGLSPSQILESRYTPDRVLKKVVNFPAGEFRWAEQIPDLPVEWIIGADGKLVEPADDLAFEAEYSRPFVDGYLRTGIPADGLVRLDEDGSFVVYPPDYPVYGT